jgi:hypothetical protein
MRAYYCILSPKEVNRRVSTLITELIASGFSTSCQRNESKEDEAKEDMRKRIVDVGGEKPTCCSLGWLRGVFRRDHAETLTARNLVFTFSTFV